MEKDWSKLAENFEDLQLAVVGNEIDQLIKEELLNIKNTGRIIEFGCGSGNYTKVLVANSNSILATDISEDMLKFAKEKLQEYKNIKVCKANCYETEFEDKSCDTVFMGNLIHVVTDPAKALAEAHRLLKDNGRIVLASFSPDGMSPIRKAKMIARYLKNLGKPPLGGTKFTLKMLEEFVNKNNFEVETAKLLKSDMIHAVFVIAKKME